MEPSPHTSSCVLTSLSLTGIKRKPGRRNCCWVSEKKQMDVITEKTNAVKTAMFIIGLAPEVPRRVDAGFAPFWLLSLAGKYVTGDGLPETCYSLCKISGPLFPWVSLLRFGCRSEGLSSYHGSVVLNFGWVFHPGKWPHPCAPSVNSNHSKSQNQGVMGINTKGTEKCEFP